MNREEFKDNPLLAVVLTFQDGAQLGLQMNAPVPQGEAMKALGHFAADVGMPSLDITLPRPPKDLVAEAIERFLAGAGEEWSSEDMAEAILRAASMPDDLAATALKVAIDEYIDARREYQLCQQNLADKEAMLKDILDRRYENLKEDLA